MTKQAERAGSTVDAILKKYAAITPDPNLQRDIFAAGIARAPYGIQRAYDYQAELNSVIRMRDYFQSLPSKTRDKFGNDPVRMLTWLGDPRNHDEARSLGLLPKDENATQGKPEASATPPAPASPSTPPPTGTKTP